MPREESKSVGFASSPDWFSGAYGAASSSAPSSGTSQGIRFREDGTFTRFLSQSSSSSFEMDGSYEIVETLGSITSDGFPGVGTVMRFTVTAVEGVSSPPSLDSAAHFELGKGGEFGGIVTEDGLSLDGGHLFVYEVDYKKAAALQRNRNKTTEAEDKIPRA
ncbi:hypothetical protein TeGR_g7116 [Tetraparma gracilis]|uniref:Uncharacterized protein n=1 Tax=Tetraparma gracilis TaxID=2962635 RepID=A0ABQ6N631_9STRA|nr:hypothetical protein TeGR_g7116 [Tetraparma gracilis]